MPHESTFIRTGLRLLCADLREQLLNIPETTGWGKLERTINQMEELADLHDRIFGPEGDREPDVAGFNRFSAKCQSLFYALAKDIPEMMTDGVVKNPDVLRMCGVFSGDATQKLRFEMRPFAKKIVPPRDWKLTEEQQQEADALLEELKTRTLQQGVSFPKDPEDEYGSLDLRKEEEREICLTGDRNDLAAFYVKNAGRLTPENKAFLETRIENSFYLDEVEQESQERERLPIFQAEETEDGARLDGYQGLYQHQSTGNGCWSCAYAMLLQSRGVWLDQRMVRGFRPAVGVDEYGETNVERVKGVLRDAVYSPYELADLTGKVLPGTALRQVAFTGLDTSDKLEDAYEAAKQCIIEALLVHQSPVALRNGNHFITIVGIEGDRLKVLDSLGYENPVPGMVRPLETTVSLKSVVERKVLSLTFLQDLKFDAAGRCTNMPPEFATAKYQDRKLINPLRGADPLNQSGGNFETFVTAGSTKYASAIYLPSEVPVVQRVLEGPEAGQNEQEQAQEQEIVDSNVPKDAEAGKNKQAQETVDPSVPENAEPTAEAADTALRKKIQAAIEEDYAQLRRVVLDASSIGEEKSDMMVADPENALRYTLANLMAHKTLLEAYDHTNVPEKDTLFEPQVQSARMAESIMKTKTFKRYYEDLTMGALADLADQPPEKQNAAIERAYRAFVNAVEPARAQTKPYSPENAKNLRKDDPSISAKQNI